MKRALLAAFCIASSCVATAAISDVTVTVGIKGYNDFFKRCDLEIDAQAGGSVARASVIYRVLAGPAAGAMCEKAPNESGCRSSDDFKPACEDISGVDVYHVKCSAENGAIIPCGKVSAKAGKGMSAPVSALPAPASVEGTLIFASLLGGPDYSDRCAVGMTYAARPEIDTVKVEYDIPVGADTARCSLNMGGMGGTGLSCLGADDFACDAVTKVNITKVICQSAGAETDCGPISLHAAEPGVFTDSR